MDEISAVMIRKSLDGLMQRYTYTAQNIANANSEGYRPVRVSFEESLRAAAAEGPDAIRQVEVEIRYGAADSLRMDLELARASQTAMRSGALIEMLNRQMSLHRSVVTGGGR